MSREKQFNIRLTDDELDQVRQLAHAHDRSINSYIRSLIRREVNKSVIEIKPRQKATQDAEYAQ